MDYILLQNKEFTVECLWMKYDCGECKPKSYKCKECICLKVVKN